MPLLVMTLWSLRSLSIHSTVWPLWIVTRLGLNFSPFIRTVTSALGVGVDFATLALPPESDDPQPPTTRPAATSSTSGARPTASAKLRPRDETQMRAR